MTLEEDKEVGDSGVLKAAIRSAKRSTRPSKIGVPAGTSSSKSSNQRTKREKVTTGKGVFERDFDGQGRKREARAKDSKGHTGKNLKKGR
jgi:ATP-dependent RNA helicase DDX27